LKHVVNTIEPLSKPTFVAFTPKGGCPLKPQRLYRV